MYKKAELTCIIDKFSTIQKNTKIFKKLFTMKSKVINNCRYVYEMFVEKIMELAEFIKFEFRRKGEYKSNLVEIYKIKEQYLASEFVQDFLKGRQKSIGPNRYKIEITTDPTPAEGNTIGEVMLMRKNRIIDKAQLITNSEVPDKEKLVYWKF